MDEQIVLREWTSIDEVPDLLDVWKSSVERRKDFISAADLDAVAKALESVYSQSLEVIIAQQGERILGFAAWNALEVELLWVRHSDRHQGIGKLLLNHITNKSPNVEVHLDTQRVLAIEFFSNSGFSLIAGGDGAASLRTVLRHECSPADNVAR